MQPIEEITSSIRLLDRDETSPHIIIHTDAAQSIGKMPVDVQMLGVDALTIVGHKFYGPRIGALWVREGAPFSSIFLGGGQEEGRRAGTENTPMIVGLGEAARLVTLFLQQDTQHFTKVRDYLVESVRKTFGEDGVLLNMEKQEKLANTANISFLNTSLNGREILSRCQRLVASVGAACHSDVGMIASSILLRQHIEKEVAKHSIRFSVGRYTTLRDVDAVVNDLKDALS